MEMRRLDPVEDEQLVREACSWIADAPLWFRNADAVWGKDDPDSYLEQMKNDPQADFGVFDGGEFIAVLTVSLKGHGVYESHLMAKRSASPSVIMLAIVNLREQMFHHGMIETWLWLVKKNYAVRRVVEGAGLIRDGVSMLKGKSHGQPIQWLRYSVRAA